MRLSHGIPLRRKQLSNKEKIVSALASVSGAASEHNTAFFQDRPIFVFSDNLGYLYWKIPGTQICGLCGAVFGQTPLYLVFWANIPPVG